MTKISKFLLFFFVSLCLACLIGSQVNALNLDYSVVGSQLYNNENSNINLTLLSSDINSVGSHDYLLNFNNNINNQSAEYIKFMFSETTSYSMETDYSLDTSNRTWQSILLNYDIMFSLVATDYSTTLCQYDNSMIICPNTKKEFYRMRISYNTKISNGSYNNGGINMTILRGVEFINSNSYQNTQQIINNNNNNTTSINNNINDVNNSINSSDINGNNSSDSISGITSSFQSSNDWLLNIFTLPYTFISSIMNGISNSCTPISLGTIFDYDLVMPCMNLNSILGNVWTTIVDVICAGVFAFAFRRRIHDFIFAIITLDRKAIKIGGVDLL